MHAELGPIFGILLLPFWLVYLPYKFFQWLSNATKKKQWQYFHIDKKGFRISGNTEPREFPYSAVSNLKYNFATYMDQIGFDQFTHIAFDFEGESFLYAIDANGHKSYKIFKYWYENGIPFSEFFDGKRAYLMKQLKYKEIQDFKKKYNIKE